MDLDIKKKLEENRIILLMMDNKEYNEAITDLAGQLSEKKLVYVTLNKTYSALKEKFSKKDITIENITFIDVISKTLDIELPDTENCFFCSSPAALTEIAITINRTLKHDFDYLIFDDLTGLLVYRDEQTLVNFVSSITNKMRNTDTKVIFLGLKSKRGESFINDITTVVDSVIDLESSG